MERRRYIAKYLIVCLRSLEDGLSQWKETWRIYIVVVILFPEEYNITHSICTTFKKSFHKCIPLAVAREAEAHRADNRYFNNDTAGGKQGARGDILLFPDVSSTLHSQNEWFNINGSDIYL